MVAPHVGAWIETFEYADKSKHGWSLPMWERGLKLSKLEYYRKRNGSLPMWERGLKPLSMPTNRNMDGSLPMWERGLKL